MNRHCHDGNARSCYLAHNCLFETMNNYFLSLGGGVLIGVFYALFKVRSPAPPGIALLGLLGMVLGERAISMLILFFG